MTGPGMPFRLKWHGDDWPSWDWSEVNYVNGTVDDKADLADDDEEIKAQKAEKMAECG